MKSWGSRCSQDAGADIADMREQGDGEGDSAWASETPSDGKIMGAYGKFHYAVAGAAVNSMNKYVV